MELYSFLLIFATEDESEFFQVSVSLWSIIHSYYFFKFEGRIIMLLVSISLRSYIHSYLALSKKSKQTKTPPFPSPCGVIFILTLKTGRSISMLKMLNVSVSLRSYIHSYFSICNSYHIQ